MKQLTILGLEKKPRSKKYKVVTTEDDYNFSEDMIIKYHIFKDQTFTLKQFEKIIEDSIQDDYFNKVLNYIAISPKSVYEIKQYIHEKEAKSKQYLKENQVSEIIKRVEALGYLNDEQLCNNVLDYYMRNNKGPLYIKQKLVLKKIDESLISKTIAKYTPSLEEDIINSILQKEKNNGYTYKKFKLSLTNKLIRNGFTSSIVYRLVDKLKVENTNDELILKDYQKALNKVNNKNLNEYDKKNFIIQSLMAKGYEYREINEFIKDYKDND